MSRKRKSNSVSPERAATAARRFRVMREDGVILASGLTAARAEGIAAALRGQHTEMQYMIKPEVAGARIVSISEYLESQKGTPTNVPNHPVFRSVPPADAGA